MLAAILTSQNQPLLVEEVEIPKELKLGQVLVKVHSSGICGSQLGEITGTKGQDKFLPHLMGHEGCGTILKVGPGVKTVKKNDLVVLHWKKGDGLQSEVPTYKWKGGKLNAGWVTTFNSHAIISENRCTSIPKNTDKELATLFGCAITTGFGVIENNAKLKMGESVVIYGSGGIGLNIIQAANLHSAYPIIAVDIHENRLKTANKVGATHLINSSSEDPGKRIREILQERELDVFIDNTGIPKFIELGYSLVHDQGRIVLVGVPRLGNNLNIYSLPLHFGKSLIGSHGGDIKPELDIPRYLNLIQKKKIKLKEIISDRYPLTDINVAINAMREGKTSGRILIEL